MAQIHGQAVLVLYGEIAEARKILRAFDKCDLYCHALGVWHDFYALTGTSAATLMGLTFVVIGLAPSLVASNPDAIRAFQAPIVAFFTAILVVSVLMMVPDWPLAAPGACAVVVSVLGASFQFVVDVHRLWRESELGLDDWFWYFGFPVLSYAVMFVSGILLLMHYTEALYGLGAAVLMLLINGIRNAWDVVVEVARRTGKPKD
jgi:hypothetical protein